MEGKDLNYENEKLKTLIRELIWEIKLGDQHYNYHLIGRAEEAIKR